MVQARLRGLLQPGYKNGLSSMLGEELILTAINAEITSEQMWQQLQLNAATLPVLKDTKNVQDMYKSASQSLIRAGKIKLMRPLKSSKRKKSSDSEIDALIKLYYALEKAQILKTQEENT